MIYGVQKTSFIDYPGVMSYVIFLGGCNFRCPFCHNKDIVDKSTDSITIESVLKDLKERKVLIKHVVITGGEPTIYNDKLIDLIKKIKDLGFKIKLDTNGTNPDLLKEMLSNNLVDYIAMDIKNTFDKYDETSGVKVNISNIKESINIIENSNIDYMFRITLNKTMHTDEDIEIVRSYIKNKDKLVLQNYKYSNTQIVDKDYGSYFTD